MTRLAALLLICAPLAAAEPARVATYGAIRVVPSLDGGPPEVWLLLPDPQKGFAANVFDCVHLYMPNPAAYRLAFRWDCKTATVVGRPVGRQEMIVEAWN